MVNIKVMNLNKLNTGALIRLSNNNKQPNSVRNKARTIVKNRENKAMRILNQWLSTGGNRLMLMRRIKTRAITKRKAKPNLGGGYPLNRFPFRKYSQEEALRRWGKRYPNSRIAYGTLLNFRNNE